MRRLRRRSWRRVGRALLFGLAGLVVALIVIAGWRAVTGDAFDDTDVSYVIGWSFGAAFGYWRGGVDEPLHDRVDLRVRCAANLEATLASFAELAVREGVPELEVHVHNEHPYEPCTVELEVAPGTIPAGGVLLAELTTPSGDRVLIKSAA